MVDPIIYSIKPRHTELLQRELLLHLNGKIVRSYGYDKRPWRCIVITCRIMIHPHVFDKHPIGIAINLCRFVMFPCRIVMYLHGNVNIPKSVFMFRYGFAFNLNLFAAYFLHYHIDALPYYLCRVYTKKLCRLLPIKYANSF